MFTHRSQSPKFPFPHESLCRKPAHHFSRGRQIVYRGLSRKPYMHRPHTTCWVVNRVLFYDSLVTSILVPTQTLSLRDTHNGALMFYGSSRNASIQVQNLVCCTEDFPWQSYTIQSAKKISAIGYFLLSLAKWNGPLRAKPHLLWLVKFLEKSLSKKLLLRALYYLEY